MISKHLPALARSAGLNRLAIGVCLLCVLAMLAMSFTGFLYTLFTGGAHRQGAL